MVTNLMLGNTIKDSGSITIDSANSQYSGTSFTVSSSNVMYSGKTNNWGNNDTSILHIYARNATEVDSNGSPYGNLYNWYTATAKSTVSSGNASYSICPAKWQLPSNTGTPSFTSLFQTSTSNGGLGISSTSSTNASFVNATRNSPYLLPLAGLWDTGSFKDLNGNGVYWSKTASSSTKAYRLRIGSNGAYDMQQNVYKYGGSSVHCIFTG